MRYLIIGASTISLKCNNDFISHRGVLELLRAPEQKVWSSKLYRNTAGIRHGGHLEFEVLRCSSKKSGSKASV